MITQNIDGLHQRAGTPPDVIELHGTMSGVVCTGCGDRTAMADALARVRAGEDDPPCARCGGILKSATIMFGETLEPGVFERAAAAAAGCDLMLAIGSTLIVEPAASLCAIAAEAGAALVIVNRDPTPYDTRRHRRHPRPDRHGRTPCSRPATRRQRCVGPLRQTPRRRVRLSITAGIDYGRMSIRRSIPAGRRGRR